MADKRTERTIAALKRALLELMEEKPSARIGVTELVERAGVGRSTFYEHFSGVADVYRALMDDFDDHTQQAGFSLREAEEVGSKRAYCRQLRGAGDFGALARDPGYLRESISAMRDDPGRCPLQRRLMEGGLDETTAWALQVFQISGCYAAAMEIEDPNDWSRAKEAIDRFMRAGIAALT